MNYTEKLLELDLLHDLGLERGDVKKVVAHLGKTKISPKNDEEWLSEVQRAVSSTRNDPLKNEIRKQAVASSEVCVICNQTCPVVYLAGGKQAYYCITHRIANPVPVE